MALGKEILGKKLLARRIVDVTKWGGSVIIRELTKHEAAEAQKFVFGTVDVKTQTITDADRLAKFNVRLIRLGWIDEDGNQIVSANEEPLLFDESNDVLEMLGGAIADMSGIGPNNNAKADIDAAKKN
jgi:hypothetical protein